MRHPLPEGGEETNHVHPPRLGETEESIPVRLLLPEDGARKDAPLLPKGGENRHHLPGKGVDGRNRRRHEVGSVEKKGYLPRHHVDAVGQVRRLLLLVGHRRHHHRIAVVLRGCALTKKSEKSVAALQNQRK